MKNQIFTIAAKGSYSILMVSIVSLMLVMLSLAANAQTFTPKGGGGGGFDASSGKATTESVTIDSKVFNLMETESGSRYIKCTSPKSGKDYAVWVGTPTEYKHEGRVVYKSSKGSYCIFKISDKSGNPYAVWLDMQ
jgi:hypothetical protein